jgi:GxxExxY protein
MEFEDLTERIIVAAIRVQREMGPGLLESTYEACLFRELTEGGIEVERQVALPVIYRGVQLDCGYRIDLLVEKKVIVELKAVERLDPVFGAQLLSYLRHSGCPVGLLFNFHVSLLRDGIRRFINTSSSVTPRAPR